MMSLPCPCCGESEASVTVGIATGEFTCLECDATFTVEDVQVIIDKWTKILKWVKAMPSDE